MGKIIIPPPVKPIVGLLSNDPELFSLVKKQLMLRYGPSDNESVLFPFDFTRYYQPEMGPDLRRQYASFKGLFPRELLTEMKRFSNALEVSFSTEEDHRRVNIDPGYVSLEQMILATTKMVSHRTYLGEGIYAELTYRFIGGSFQPLEWTYRDYCLPQRLEFFNQVRWTYRRQLKK
jgi:hypothetical protein